MSNVSEDTLCYLAELDRSVVRLRKFIMLNAPHTYIRGEFRLIEIKMLKIGQSVELDDQQETDTGEAIDANNGDDTKSISLLFLPGRAYRALRKAGVMTIGDLKKVDLKAFKGNTRNFGESSMHDVRGALEKYDKEQAAPAQTKETP